MLLHTAAVLSLQKTKYDRKLCFYNRLFVNSGEPNGHCSQVSYLDSGYRSFLGGEGGGL